MFTKNTRNTFAAISRRPYICRACLWNARTAPLEPARHHIRIATRFLQTESQPPSSDDTPFRKLLKDAAKQQKSDTSVAVEAESRVKRQDPRLEKWELTVGIEVHAELNTARKLFSHAATSVGEGPNTHVSLFDTAFPGSQPSFQKETLIPAIRAALAFECEIQPRSSFDRKHYFYQDQPAGYQITQFYEPFAKNGRVVLQPHDFPPGAVPEETSIEIGIKQIQMEQDTAKTVQHPPSSHLLDFNRVSHPLIEIITLPQIHDPVVAAAVVRKIQNMLKTVDACTTGMELGGLRADVNVSIRERNKEASDQDHSYSGVTGLGQRTEIKNLASLKAVEDAIIAERNRQIDVLESGGVIEGETRGWTLEKKNTTTRLRGKEGEVDYRYMPDPDIPPVFIGKDLVNHLRTTLPNLPDRTVSHLVTNYGFTVKDALTIMSLDNGDRLDYLMGVVQVLKSEIVHQEPDITTPELGKLAGNWVLMELGGLFRDHPWDAQRIPPAFLSRTIACVRWKKITSRSAKRILAMKFEGDTRTVTQIIAQDDLALKPTSRAEYLALAQTVLDEKPGLVKDIVEKGQHKKIKWFVGQMMVRSQEGAVEPDVAEETLKELLGQAERKW